MTFVPEYDIVSDMTDGMYADDGSLLKISGFGGLRRMMSTHDGYLTVGVYPVVVGDDFRNLRSYYILADMYGMYSRVDRLIEPGMII